MACCLQWRHLCPTAPDTLTCYPFGADDPFVLQQCPHIMFAGNQPEFDTRLMEGELRCCWKVVLLILLLLLLVMLSQRPGPDAECN
jgi:DNA polymerase delta subunit 2